MIPTTDLLRYGAIMLSAGIGVPVLAALNAQLGVRLGSAPAGAVCMMFVAFLCAAVVVALSGETRAIPGVLHVPKYLFLAGGLMAYYILTITYIAPRFGVGNAVFFVLLGQLVSAGVIDHFGLMGSKPDPISLTRVAGIALMAAGVMLTQLR